jgi:hypothetical protein
LLWHDYCSNSLWNKLYRIIIWISMFCLNHWIDLVRTFPFVPVMCVTHSEEKTCLDSEISAIWLRGVVRQVWGCSNMRFAIATGRSFFTEWRTPHGKAVTGLYCPCNIKKRTIWVVRILSFTGLYTLIVVLHRWLPYNILWLMFQSLTWERECGWFYKLSALATV